jgi:Flp pilus assembly protein TadB
MAERKLRQKSFREMDTDEQVAWSVGERRRAGAEKAGAGEAMKRLRRILFWATTSAVFASAIMWALLTFAVVSPIEAGFKARLIFGMALPGGILGLVVAFAEWDGERQRKRREAFAKSPHVHVCGICGERNK